MISYSFLLIFQILHIFEEIGMEIYKINIISSLKKYLRGASVIMSIYIISYLLIALDLKFGIWLGLFCSTLAMGNFLIHTIGYIKFREFRGNIASGVFSSIPLGILGGINLYFLLKILQS
ncbi:MAG: HXXEE domain-containing protein [Promethearchaeota archaeon]